MKLDTALTGVARLGFDTSPIIYFVEANPKYDELITNIFQRIADGSLLGMTTAIALLEVLVVPLRQHNIALQDEYRDLLLHSHNFATLNITAESAQIAADLRTRHGLKTPDALQIACALENGCDAFLCNDLAFRRVTELRVLILDELEL